MSTGKPIFDTAQIEQIRKMLREGESVKAMQEFFKTTYNLLLPAWKISYEKGKLNRHPHAGEKSKKAICIPESSDDLLRAVHELESEIQAFCQCVRKTARREIVKYVAKIRQTRIVMGDRVSSQEKTSLELELKRLGITGEDIEEVKIA